MTELQQLVQKFCKLKILVVGDPMRDVYHFGKVDRMCPEAPVPVFLPQDMMDKPGGADNVRNNLEQLCIKVDAIFPDGFWIEKHRYMVGGHQLMRVDHEITYDFDWRYKHPISVYDAIVISDYAKGSCTELNCQWLISVANIAKKPVIVDPKGSDWKKYDGATVICPNHHEFEAVQYKNWPLFPCIMLKRGADGIRVMTDDQHIDYPALAKHVFDVTGAGDTVTAVVAATIAAGGTYHQAAQLANIAASVVVGEVGTSPITYDRLFEECA
jgi:D-beta-D-heptose 7-phosphate kinase/D-beta-D-heptose 1-phosphate adenosyltransferase